MKKFLLVLALIVFLAIPSFASVGANNAGTMAGTATNILYNCPSGTKLSPDGSNFYSNCGNLMSAGTANGGATSMTTSTLIVPVTYDYVRKAIAAIADPAWSTGTLANGKPGQLLTIFITSVGSSGTWTLTPATSTGWATIQFNTAKQSTTFLYVNDTVGWVIIANNSSASGAEPTITLP